MLDEACHAHQWTGPTPKHPLLRRRGTGGGLTRIAGLAMMIAERRRIPMLRMTPLIQMPRRCG